jgi:hypothetical protein
MDGKDRACPTEWSSRAEHFNLIRIVGEASMSLIDQVLRVSDGDAGVGVLPYCGRPTFRTNSANRGSERMVSSV